VIQIKGSPNQENIVKPVFYDNMRRDNAKVYMPYISENNTAAKENSPFTKQTAFYQNLFGVDDGQYAYVENVFEASPLNRILQTYNVGDIYRTEDKKSVNNYQTNTAGEVFALNVNPTNNFVTFSLYAPNTLYKNSTTNEDGATVYSYTDKAGRTVLTRTIGENNQKFDTYYGYDEIGQLVMVISPEYSAAIGTSTTLIPGSSMVAHYCYTYKYDGRGNVIERQQPGKDVEYMIYDKGGRLVLCQDGNMRPNNQWTYCVYDNVGNLTDKTLVKTTLTRQQIQTKYFATVYNNDYVSLGESNSIYRPFADSNDFTTEYLIESVRYYGKYYYKRNELVAGTYLKVNTNQIPSAGFGISLFETASDEDELTESIDISGETQRKADVLLPIIDDPLPPTPPPGGGVLPPPVIPRPVLKPDSLCDPNHLYINSQYHVKNTYLYYTDELFPNIKYYLIPAEYMSIAQCLETNFIAYSIFTGIPGGNEPVLWKIPASLAFEPVAGVCTFADLDSVKVRHLKAYEILRILIDNGDYVERAFYYDYMGRLIQTVERNQLKQISRYSTKYDFTGNVLAQHESHKTSSAAADVKLTTFVYDMRGRLLSEKTTINNSDTAKVVYKYNELGQLAEKIYDNNVIRDSTKYNIQGWVTEKSAKQGNDNIFNMQLAYYDPAKPNTTPSYTGNITEWSWQHENELINTYAFAYDKLSRLTDNKYYEGANITALNSFTEQGFTYDRNGNIKTLKRYGELNLQDDLTLTHSGNRLINVNQILAYGYDANGNMRKDFRRVNALKME
jgi:hypothetical protein